LKYVLIFSALILIAQSFVCFAELIVICNYRLEAPGRHYAYQLELGSCVMAFVSIRMLIQSHPLICICYGSEVGERQNFEDCIVFRRAVVRDMVVSRNCLEI
jgi:hypothetical protein